MAKWQKEPCRKLQEFTGRLCAQCPVPGKHRCCDKVFCYEVWREMDEESRAKYSPDWNSEVPLFKDGRCQVEPHDRPFCTGYVCPDWLKDRKTRREYERLCEKASIPPNRRGLFL